IENLDLDDLSEPIGTMADQRTMAQLLQTPTEGYEDAIVVPAITAENFKPKHGLLTLVQNKQFFGHDKEDPHAHDQDSLNSPARGNFLDRMPHECLGIIESKSKVRYSRNPVVAKVSTTASTSGISPDVAELKDMVRALLLDKKGQSPAHVKAVEENCVTCGGAHSYRNCPATDGNNYRDNIQEFVSQASAVNFNQGNTVMRNMQMQGQNIQNQLTNLTDLMTKFVNVNTASISNSGTLPSNTIANPRSDLKAITTRSGVSIPPPPSFLPPVVENKPEATKDTVNPTNNGNTEDEKLCEMARTPLNEHCSAVLLKKLPEKLGDPGKFLIPCDLPGMAECLALADLDASINLMPYSVWKRLVSNPSSNPNPSTNPNPKGRNRRRSKQRIEEFNLDELSPPIVTMTDQRTVAQLLQARTEGYEDAIVIPAITADNFELKHAWDRFKDLLRACPHHGFSELHQLDTFYNALNSKDQDSLNSAAGGNFLDKMPRECLAIIESKSKVHYSRNKPVVAKVSTNTSTSGISPDVAELKDMMKVLLLDKKWQNQSPAFVKVVKESCVTCGGAHSYHNCPATDGNVYHDNIQEFVSQAFAVNYNQGNTSYPPPMMFNQIRPPGFPPIPNNQNVVEDEPEATKDTVNPTNNKSNKDVQPQVVHSESPILHYEPVTFPISEPIITPVSALKPNPKSSIPYPSRRNDERNREKANNQIEKFYHIFKDMSFEISFADALIPMPKFVSTLKALIRNKEKLSEMAQTPLNEHCFAILLKKLHEKLGDPGKFLIPCDFLADHSISRPVGVAEDVYVKVGSFHFPADFVVVDFDADPRVPLILGRSFLKTGRDLIDVFEAELTLRVGKEAITFNLDQTSRYSANYSDMTAKRIDVIDMACEEYLQEVLAYLDPEGDILQLESFLNDDPSLPPPNQGNNLPEVRKELNIYAAKSKNLHLINPQRLSSKTYLPTLNMHSWKKLSNIKGIDPEFCTHKILMEEDFEPAVQHQRRRNPKIHDIIKQEVIKLLEAGLIYPISDSPWVSPMYCVPKNGGFIVEENEDNELIPTRLVKGWCVCIDYCKLNEATRKDHFPLPFTNQMLERLAGTFQRCMMAIFHDMIEKTMEVFMDDFSVFKTSFQSCLSHLERMLKRCEDTNLCLNWEKSHFMVKEDWDMPFELMCDASDFAIGAILGQRQDKHFRPIHYANKTITKAESNYTTTKKETLAVVHRPFRPQIPVCKKRYKGEIAPMGSTSPRIHLQSD
nr:hypothetical protein [Tanacetum cinerariifolium]